VTNPTGIHHNEFIELARFFGDAADGADTSQSQERSSITSFVDAAKDLPAQLAGDSSELDFFIK
jgi:hypothetical protein